MPNSARVLLPALLAALVTAAPPAAARAESPSAYTKTQTYSCVLRYLRVDRGYEILEKDAEAAYVLFHYPVPGQKAAASGAMEIIDTPGGVKLVVQLPRLPSYHETLLRDGLLRKLRDEYGPPPPKSAPPPAKPEPPADGSAPKKPDGPKENGDE
jgi:hypothetical protein